MLMCGSRYLPPLLAYLIRHNLHIAKGQDTLLPCTDNNNMDMT